MAKMIEQDTISLAWLDAIEHLHGCKDRKDVNLSVVIRKPGIEDSHVRKILDSLLAKRQEQCVATVANTIFPASLYMPEKLGAQARDHLYECSNKGYMVARRHSSNRYGRYIQRFHLTALYRNQHFFRKAYGNYVGLRGY